jgi:hypothetical protein
MEMNRLSRKCEAELKEKNNMYVRHAQLFVALRPPFGPVAPITCQENCGRNRVVVVILDSMLGGCDVVWTSSVRKRACCNTH